MTGISKRPAATVEAHLVRHYSNDRPCGELAERGDSGTAGRGGRQDLTPRSASSLIAEQIFVGQLPGSPDLMYRLRSLRDGQRVDFRGNLIGNVAHASRCSDCGMGTTDDDEYHPYLACLVFKRTHDSREVWRALRRAAGGAYE